MDVRGRRLRKHSDDATSFVSSMTFDKEIARHVVSINMAHMISLTETGSVPEKVASRCLAFLANSRLEPQVGTAFEDIHQMLEQKAVDSLGVGVAGYINYGKSRNDQVATALRMETRERILRLIDSLTSLQESILRLVLKYGKAPMPGYTHLQRAQPVTIAHHLFSHFDSFQRCVQRLLQLYERVNLSPMGSAALGGTSVNLDRKRVASLLGFDGLVSNAMDGVSSRDVFIETLSCCSLVMLELSRLSEEVILWSTHEFGFLELQDEYTASSSIMPQKKNAVVAETARAKCGSVIGSLVAAATILKSLPCSYNLDLQEVTPHVWKGTRDTIDSVDQVAGMLSGTVFNVRSIERSMEQDYSTATALANFLVSHHGISFRLAHSIVGELVRRSLEKSEPFLQTVVSDMPDVSSRMGRRIEIDPDSARRVLSVSYFLESVVTEGGSNPSFIHSELDSRRRALKANKTSLSILRRSILRSETELKRLAISFAKEVRD